MKAFARRERLSRSMKWLGGLAICGCALSLLASAVQAGTATPLRTDLVCKTYPDGIILCRDRKTGKVIQECKGYPDGRTVCKPR